MKVPQSTVFYAHVHRDLVAANASIQTLAEDVNAKIRQHGGIILANRQFLCRPIEMDWRLEAYLDDDTTTPFEHPVLEWGDAQRKYFGDLWGTSEPYQYSAEADQYDRYCIAGRYPTPYLAPGEVVHTLVEAVDERKWIECECHRTQLVYTSRHRLVCMGCGDLYRVLAEPLPETFEAAITNEQWESAFDEHGELIDDDLEVPILNYRKVKQAPYIWTTDAWDQATWLLEFYAEGNEEEIKRYEAGQPTIDDFLAAGWREVPMPPSASSQLGGTGVEIDLWKNAERAVRSAASAFALSRTKPEALREAVLHAFQAIELTLKMRLEQFGPDGSKGNNPTVLRLLAENGVAITVHESAVISDLRGMRNKLQHAGAMIAYRDTRRLLRAAFTFLDRFTIDELDLWLNHACDPEGWRALLQIRSIAANAERKSEALVAEAHTDPTVEAVTTCAACGRERMVSFNFGFRNCVYCRDESHV